MLNFVTTHEPTTLSLRPFLSRVAQWFFWRPTARHTDEAQHYTPPAVMDANNELLLAIARQHITNLTK